LFPEEAATVAAELTRREVEFRGPEMERLMGLEPTTFSLGSEKMRTQQALIGN